MPSKLRVVPPSDPPETERLRQRIKKMARPGSMLECRCGSREFIQTRSGVLFKDGKATGGTKTLICAACFLKGDRVVVA